MFGTMLLSILALLLFVLALATMIFLKDVQDGLKAMVLAYLISPYGIPLFATSVVRKDWGYKSKTEIYLIIKEGRKHFMLSSTLNTHTQQEWPAVRAAASCPSRPLAF